MNAFWTRGYRREGKAFTMGLVVVRPGYVAFLPLGFAMGAGDQFALGAARARSPALTMNVAWQGRYPINAWWQHGERVFDEEVRRALAQPGAALLTNAEAGFASRKLLRAFVPFVPGAPLITLDQAPPPVLMLSWRPGIYPFDAKKARMLTGIASAVLMGLGALFTAIIWFQGEGLNPVPLVFFGIVTAIIWGAYVKSARDHARDVEAAAQLGGPVGPYR